MTPNIPVNISVANPPRGPGTQRAGKFVGQSMTASFAWGSSPGTATVVYIALDPAWTIVTGAYCALQIGSHFFAGICLSDVLNSGSGEGLTRTLQFADLREFLKWDYTFCAFNKPDVRLVNGVRVKRYKHVYPADYATLTWTYTNAPLAAWAILGAIMSFKAPSLAGGVAGGTIGLPWSWDLTGNGQFPGGLMNFPIYDLDCLNGKRLDGVLNEFCERSGCVFGLLSTPTVPYNLVFTRKGYGSLPGFPANSDNRRIGASLSGNPTNVCVLGDRNLYQVMDVPMAADWSAAWEQFLVFELFVNDIFNRCTDANTGQRFNAISGDNTEHTVGWQLALAWASTVTVGQYVAMRNAAVAGAGIPFMDPRKYAGRWRMDMPAALYIRSLLFRAFRPDPSFTFYNKAGAFVPLTSLDIMDQLLCRVYQSDPSAGTMQFDLSNPADGNGYAMARGYQVGADLFKYVSSTQFNLNFFKDATAVWQHIPFQIDDSGEGVRFIIFDEPVIISENLVTVVDGHSVINANASLEVPSVVAALVFAAERYAWWQGTYPNVSRDHVENVGGLNRECVVQSGGYTEVLYADSVGADAKAAQIASAILLWQFQYIDGGHKLIWQPGTNPATFGWALSSLIDRIQITTGPREGTFEVIDFTTERQRDHFEPERELDRRTQTNSLFPGQAELRIQAEDSRKLAAAFKQLPGLSADLAGLLAGTLGNNQPTELTRIGGSPGAGTLPVGTVIRRQPTVAGTPNLLTLATNPASVTAADSVFLGVTVRDGEDKTAPFQMQRTGMALALVQGPVAANDGVGLSDTNSYLVKSGAPAVGIVKQAIADTSVRLVQVDLGAGGSSGIDMTLCVDGVPTVYTVQAKLKT